MTTTERDALDRAIERGLDAVWRMQREDGAIDGINHGGPLYSGIALAARAQVGDLDDDDVKRVVPWMRSQQLGDGSFAPSPCATQGTLDATVCAYAGLAAAGVSDDDDAQKRAAALIAKRGGFAAANPMYFPTLAVAGVMSAEELPTPHLFFELIPFSQQLMGRHFNQWIGMSANITPALTEGLRDGGRASWWLHPLKRLEEEKVLEFLEDVQNPAGSLSGVLIYTAQLVSTFAALGVDPEEKNFAAARAALGRFRTENDVGMEYMPFTAEIWNTAEAVRASVRAGVDPRKGDCKRAIDWLLAHQTTEDAPEAWQNPRKGAPRHGGWPFEAANVRNPDCDTSGAVLHALGAVLARAEIPEVRKAVDRGVDWLVPMQNPDGGWPSMTRDNGAKPPGPFFEKPFWPPSTLKDMMAIALDPPLELQDPSTAAMTGRIMRGLAECGVSGVDPAMKAAVEFMKRQQWNERWWGRWEVNYVAGTAFGLIGLARAGVDMGSDWVARAAQWLVGRQNEDGGFGEGTETYADWRLPGPWPSRADLTGKALMGMVDALGPADAAVQRAVAWLVQAQRADGSWKTDDGEYVILPPDLFYTNPASNQVDAVEGLIYYREILDRKREGTMSDWSDAHLDAMRLVGDPRADEVVRQLFEENETSEVSELFHQLTKDDAAMPQDMPEPVRRYFEETESLPAWADPELLKKGEEVFGEHGMSMVCGLFCSSLPHAYCAKRGAVVLVETGRMVDDFTRRIVETAQFVMDVMAPGGLSPEGRGIRTAQKIRLIHAAVRYMLATRREWPTEELGVPINQEDLAGTLLTFSTVILAALDTMEQEISEEERRAYFHAWRCVGHVMGIRPDMIPVDLADAEALYAAIARRQFGASEQGTILTKALIDAMERYVPGKLFDGAAGVYVRHFMGDELADMLEVPATDWTNVVYEAQTALARLFDHETERHPLMNALWGKFTTVIMEGLSAAFREGKGVQFRIPDELRGRWKLDAP